MAIARAEKRDLVMVADLFFALAKLEPRLGYVFEPATTLANLSKLQFELAPYVALADAKARAAEKVTSIANVLEEIRLDPKVVSMMSGSATKLDGIVDAIISAPGIATNARTTREEFQRTCWRLVTTLTSGATKTQYIHSYEEAERLRRGLPPENSEKIVIRAETVIGGDEDIESVVLLPPMSETN
jgi:hypothetical protein